MTKRLKFVTLLFATTLFAIPSTLLAQNPDGESDSCDEEQTDNCIAQDVAKDVAEHITGLPTSTGSAVTMGLEKITGLPFSAGSAVKAGAMASGMSDAAAAALGDAASGFLGVTFDSSSIATDEEEGSPYQMEQQEEQAQQAAAAYQFYLSHKAEFDQNYHQWLNNLKVPPAGPQYVPCTQYCNK